MGAGHCGSRIGAPRQRLHEAGHDVRVRPVQPIEQLCGCPLRRPSASTAPLLRSHVRTSASPSPCRSPLGRDHRVAAPRALDLDALDRDDGPEASV